MLKIMKASAGSGKTYSLARTYIALLLKNQDRYAYRHILAVTFTNKATEEMKNRILKELHTMAVRPSESAYHDYFVPSMFSSTDEMQKKAGTVLKDILHDYSAFAVSTIDRFFQQTLKAFSREIGQFASYQVELDKNSLVAESVDRILDSLSEDSGSLLTWLTDNVLEQIEQGGRYNMDANLLNMALRLKSSQRAEVLEKENIDEDKACSKENLTKVRKGCREVMSSFRKSLRETSKAVLEVMESAGVSPDQTNRKFMGIICSYSGMNDTDPVVPPKPGFFTKAADHEQWFAKSKAKELLPKVYPMLEGPLEDFCRLWGSEYKVFSTACILDAQIYGLGVAGELRKTYKEILREKNVLSIDDSNTILRDIIDGSDAPFVYEKIGVRFDHFLLDEFQDTASVQWTNFSPLLHNSDAQGGENLVVGDVKQSIYRWRGSDWRLLDRMIPEEFPGHEEEVLDTNYRSLGKIVGFNNLFFTRAADVLDAVSGQNEGNSIGRIYEDVGQKVAKSSMDGGSVQLTFCDKDKELEYVHSAVLQALGKGASYSDIAVLVRSNAVGEQVASYLMGKGITVITDDSLKVRSSITVRRIVSIMSYIDNPEDTVNGFLSASLDVHIPSGSLSLIDMAESIIRDFKESDEDGVWKGEVLHIQSFMDYLSDYVTSNGNNLRGFLKYWEGEDPSISSPSSGESIRIMTIHKSKGLDFPYVILPYVENITLYKAGNYWCAPELKGSALEGIAEGVYDVMLSRHSADTLFEEHYSRERFLQYVDNMNTIYVAMTRASLGMHIIAQKPSDKHLESIGNGALDQFTDFSQILYWFVSESDFSNEVTFLDEEDAWHYTYGDIVDFKDFRREDRADGTQIDLSGTDSYPSVPLNPYDGEDGLRIMERGRLRLSADSRDFFSEDGDAGISASNRIRGVVLHDILAKVRAASDLDAAVSEAVMNGELAGSEEAEVSAFLKERMSRVQDYGWFSEDADRVLNEAEVIDVDGGLYRPDRVVRKGDSVIVIDYKFGEHYRKYEHQIATYADIWRRMGYGDVKAYLWYVGSGEVVEVC